MAFTLSPVMSVIYQQTKCCVLCFHSAVCIIFKSEDID